jgi:CHAT domain-containing protein
VVQREAASRPAAAKLLVAFGDPVFSSNYALKAPAIYREQAEGLQAGNNQKLQRSPEEKSETLDPANLQPLFFARQELNELGKLTRADQSVIYADFEANRENLRNMDLRQYRILHFATHGLLDSRQPELSGLVLSLVDRNGRPVNGFVSLADIYNLRAPVDLVVLSACRTALGKEVRGEGLIGLMRGFMYAGASGVVATLWKVDDEATAELMKCFYTNLLQQGMTPGAALRAAQNSIRQKPQWRAPYYWAAFTLQGEYRQVIKPTPAVGASDLYRRIMAGGALVMLSVGVAWWYRRRRLRTTKACG